MKKCLVLDLDNTLWGGVVGEDGMENLALSVTPPGNSFLAFQQAIRDLYDRGILLAINSRNNPEDALHVIRNHPNMILKENHFAAMRINWTDKTDNIRELAKELNIGLDSMVFLDDDETNRELMRSLVPEVETPELPKDPQAYTKFLRSLDYFTTDVITDEDKMRGNLYVTERLRKEEEKQHVNKEEFLRSLGLELTIFEDDASCLPRLAQLTEKTNQFNILKTPLTEEDIRACIENPESKVFYASLEDKFGDYGVILFAIIDTQESVWHIRSLLMSCRVFGRGVEEAFLAHLIKRAQESGATKITTAFAESEKNAPAKEFVEKHFSQGSREVNEGKEVPVWVAISVPSTK